MPIVLRCLGSNMSFFEITSFPKWQVITCYSLGLRVGPVVCCVLSERSFLEKSCTLEASQDPMISHANDLVWHIY